MVLVLGLKISEQTNSIRTNGKMWILFYNCIYMSVDKTIFLDDLSPVSKVSREVANLTERKKSTHTHIWCQIICLSVCLTQSKSKTILWLVSSHIHVTGLPYEIIKISWLLKSDFLYFRYKFACNTNSLAIRIS